MTTSENLDFTVNFILNGFLHVTLLFSFLTILYYYIVSPLTISSLRDLIGSLIDSIFDANVPTTIISLSDLKQSITANVLSNVTNTSLLNNISSVQENTIKYNLVNFIYNNLSVVNNYIEQNSTVNDLVSRNNQVVISYSFIISISLAVISIILMIIFKTAAPNHINLTELVIENLGTFVFVGAIEYWFFTTYAFNYIPTPASLITNSAIDEIKNLLEKPYRYSSSTEIPPLIVKPTPILIN